MYKQQYTLTIVFNKDKTNVLMCMHNKQQMLNFIGGKVELNESQTEASYRELLRKQVFLRKILNSIMSRQLLKNFRTEIVGTYI